MQNNTTIDDILEVLENPTRRMILRELAREPRYSLQLAQMLNVSQQAIMKHLRAMEDKEMVTVMIEKSDAGGPPRKCYVASRRFSVTIDMGPGLFEEVVREFGEATEQDDRESYGEEKPLERLSEAMSELERLNGEMDALEGRRAMLVQEKERLMRSAYELAERACDDEDSKRVLRHLIEGGSLTVEGVAESLNMREKAARDALDKLRLMGLTEGGEEHDAKKAKARRRA
jgi:predicted transcriptional regulator